LTVIFILGGLSKWVLSYKNMQYSKVDIIDWWEWFCTNSSNNKAVCSFAVPF